MRLSTELQTCSGWNAQAPYGADVISRIQYTLEKPDGLPELSRRIREQIWALVSDALARSGRTPGTLREITLAGNTVMQHLFAGYSVRGIAAAPFRPETLFAAPGDETLHGVPVHFAPCVAGYVGGDITAGLLAAGLAELPGENLFLDIGTNGEMALGGRGGFVCCAVASGPAFEGAGITCGMPGVDGAISRVRYDRGFLYDVIGGGEPKGLCGSGLLDLTAVLLRLGVIAPGGRLLPPEDAPMPLRRYLTRDDDGNGRFHLTPEVSLTAADVRNLQLAKAAVAAGIRVLLQQRGIAPEQVDGVYLAGLRQLSRPRERHGHRHAPARVRGQAAHARQHGARLRGRAHARPRAVAAHREYFPGMRLSGAVRPRRFCRGLYRRSVVSATITFHGGHDHGDPFSPHPRRCDRHRTAKSAATAVM